MACWRWLPHYDIPLNLCLHDAEHAHLLNSYVANRQSAMQDVYRKSIAIII